MKSNNLSKTAKKVIDAYGGEEFWKNAREIKAIVSASGLAFTLKWQRPFKNILVVVDVNNPKIRLSPIDKAGNTGVLNGNEVYLESPAGSIIKRRENPREKFPGGIRLLWWDILDQTYFAGYAFWNYFTFPSLLLRDDIVWKEIEFGKLEAHFPSYIPTHCERQVFHFNTDTGLLVQHDYTAEVIGKWAKAANVVLEHKEWSGVRFPSRRRITPRKENGRVAVFPVLIEIEVEEWGVVVG